MRSASIGVDAPRSRRRAAAPASQAAAAARPRGPARGDARRVPEQRDDVLEVVLRELLEPVPGDDELAALAVDHGSDASRPRRRLRVRGSLASRLRRHGRNVWCRRLRVNIDSTINMQNQRKPPGSTPTKPSKLLGVSRATLVCVREPRPHPFGSRGRRRRAAAATRATTSSACSARSRERRNPEKAAEQALHWGLPILESAITLIADERIYYRGHDAGALARERSLAEVAALLWTGTADGSDRSGRRHGRRAAPRARGDVPFIARGAVGARARRGRRRRSPTICGRAPSRRRAGASSGC